MSDAAASQQRLRGAKIDDLLKAQLKANREAVIAELQRRQEESRDRYGRVPDGSAAMTGRLVNLAAAQRESVLAYVFRQPRTVHAWAMGRAAEYHAQGVPLGEDEVSACVDVLAWQRNTNGREAVKWLEGLDEAVQRVEGLKGKTLHAQEVQTVVDTDEKEDHVNRRPGTVDGSKLAELG